MSFSFVEIEEQKTRFVWGLFAVLIVFYFFVAWLLIIPFKLTFLLRTVDPAGILPNLKQSLIALIIAAVAGALHWHFSVDGVVGRSLAGIGAQPADEKDAVCFFLQPRAPALNPPPRNPFIQACEGVAYSILNRGR